jgi:hypothetical protein
MENCSEQLEPQNALITFADAFIRNPGDWNIAKTFLRLGAEYAKPTPPQAAQERT